MAPEPTMPSARELVPGPALRAATTFATAQNAPVASAVRKRAPSRTSKLSPSATITCPAAKTPSASISVTRREDAQREHQRPPPREPQREHRHQRRADDHPQGEDRDHEPGLGDAH